MVNCIWQFVSSPAHPDDWVVGETRTNILHVGFIFGRNLFSVPSARPIYSGMQTSRLTIGNRQTEFLSEQLTDRYDDRHDMIDWQGDWHPLDGGPAGNCRVAKDNDMAPLWHHLILKLNVSLLTKVWVGLDMRIWTWGRLAIMYLAVSSALLNVDLFSFDLHWWV